MDHEYNIYLALNAPTNILQSIFDFVDIKRVYIICKLINRMDLCIEQYGKRGSVVRKIGHYFYSGQNKWETAYITGVCGPRQQAIFNGHNEIFEYYYKKELYKEFIHEFKYKNKLYIISELYIALMVHERKFKIIENIVKHTNYNSLKKNCNRYDVPHRLFYIHNPMFTTYDMKLLKLFIENIPLDIAVIKEMAIIFCKYDNLECFKTISQNRLSDSDLSLFYNNCNGKNGCCGPTGGTNILNYLLDKKIPLNCHICYVPEDEPGMFLPNCSTKKINNIFVHKNVKDVLTLSMRSYSKRMQYNWKKNKDIHHSNLVDERYFFKKLFTYCDIDVNVRNKINRTVLHREIGRIELGYFTIFLNHPNIDVNAQDLEGKTPLMMACERGLDTGHFILKKFINHPKMDLSIRDNNGNTALMIAKINNSKSMIRLIKQKLKSI